MGKKPQPAPKLSLKRTALVQRVDAFLAANPGITASDIGTEIMNDTSLIFRLRRGRPLLDTTIDKIETYLATKKSPD